MATPTEIKTKDSYDLTTVLLDGMETFQKYNDEVDRPFKSLFTRSVSERVFSTDLRGDMTWDEVGEGEHMGTGSTERDDTFMSVSEFGRALNWNRQHIERSTREELNAEFTKLVQGYDKMERNKITTALMSGAHDGSTDSLWFEPEDKGEYEFGRDHNHQFASTDDLFYNDEYGTDSTSGTAHTPTEHVRRINAHLRHHEKDPEIVLCSSLFKEEFIDEMAWEADYHFPEASGLRTDGLDEANARVDGTTLVETPWINDYTSPDGTYQLYGVSSDNPIAMNEEVPIQMVNGEAGPPINQADQIFNAHGYARFGLKVDDPLSIVSVTADNLA